MPSKTFTDIPAKPGASSSGRMMNTNIVEKKLSSERLKFLDGMRGIAILLVLLFHAYVRWPEVVPYGAKFAGNVVLANGWLGVQLFFMVSGFVIFMTLEKCRSFSDFLIRRWLRLFPAMLICSVIIFITASFFHERPAGAVSIRDLLPGLTFIQPEVWSNLFGTHQGLAEGAFWSLFVEVKFYLIAGLAYFLLGNIGAICAILLIFLLVPVEHALAHTHHVEILEWLRSVAIVLDAKHFGWFSAGALYYRYFTSDRKVYLACALLVALLAVYMQEGFQGSQKLIPLLVATLFFSGIVSERVKTLLSLNVFVFLGFISYPLYLVHENMMVATIVKVNRFAPDIPLVMLPLFGALLVVCIAWLVAKYGEPWLKGKLGWVRSISRSHRPEGDVGQ